MDRTEDDDEKDEPVRRLSDIFRKNSKESSPADKLDFEPQVIEEFNPESPDLIK